MHFFLRLNASRPTFQQDMSDDERAIMTKHVAYWKTLLDSGKVVVFGPVFDPSGGFGIGIVLVESEQEVRELMANDPATGILRYECHPMRAVLPG